MPIESLTLSSLDIPFRVAFKHSSATRSTTQAVLIKAHSDSGAVGYGEGCPREYVTGESLASAEDFFQRYRSRLVEQVSDENTLRDWISANAEALNQNPAAWCALELALLDLFAKERSVSVEALLGLNPLLPQFQYSAVLGDSSAERFRAMALRYQQMGFKDFKVKLSGNLKQDQLKAEVLWETASTDTRLRLDANNLWDEVEVAASYLKALQLPFFAIEEPLRAFDYDGLSQLAGVAGCRIILDESLLTAEHVRALAAPASMWIANIRVSKMGGVLRSLQVVEAARAAGIDIILGAQVGETSVLTRAAMTVASQVGERLLAQEGAFGTLLLESDVCEPPLMFGVGGLLKTSEFEWFHSGGFGVPFT